MKTLFIMVIFMSISYIFAQIPPIIAHRGASYDAPENTLGSFNLAWHQNAEAIEGDFHLTKDKEIVCIHDYDTLRVAKEKWVIAESTYQELQKLDVGSWKAPQWAKERIPTLKEVLATIPVGKKFFLEIKCGVEIMPYLVKQIRETHVAHEQIVFISFSSEVIAECKKHLPSIKAYWLTSYKKENDAWRPSIQEILALLKAIKADGLDCRAHECIDTSFVNSLKKEGFEFHIWTVDDVAVAKHFIALGVQSITSNRPQWLKSELEK
ncbi:MAG: glycerophosphodiester phosphodiesterase [Candidatus Brocadiae bacterium]|nr:glycerophosphodiester phosphodiesterase [Candidatus Brocadiia bacterium]